MKPHFAWGLAVMGLLGIFLLRAPMTVSSDGTRYLMGAKFISEGKGYSTYGFDSQEIHPQIQWPPFLSSLTALVMKIASLHEIDALKTINFFSLLIYYAVFYRLAMLLFEGGKFRLAAQGIVFLTPVSWRFLNEALSECLFTGLFGLALFMIFQTSLRARKKSPALLLLGAGIITLLLCLTRYAGLFIAAGFFLFLVTGKRQSWSGQKLRDIALYALPIGIGMTAWLIRNEAVSGHLTALELRPPRAPISNYFLEEAEFLRAVFESLAGYTSYFWTIPWAHWIPPLIGFAASLAVILTFVRQKISLPEEGPTRRFVTLAACIVAACVIGLNWVHLKYGTWSINRYFAVLNPLIFLSFLILLDTLASPSPSEKKTWKGVSIGILSAFLLIAGFFHSLNLAKEVYGSLKRKASSSIAPKAWLPGFENSTWAYDLLKDTIQKSDILISNNPTYLMYAGVRQCRSTFSGEGEKAVGFRGFDKPKIALQEVKASDRQVYLILEKKYPCVAFAGDCHDYLNKLRYEVLREDPWAIAAKLIQ